MSANHVHVRFFWAHARRSSRRNILIVAGFGDRLELRRRKWAALPVDVRRDLVDVIQQLSRNRLHPLATGADPC